MKYIVMQVASPEKKMVLEIPFIFPNIIVHEMMREHIKTLLQKQFPHPYQITCLSAAEFSSMDIQADCHGESTSIGIKTRGYEDETLISMCDYGSIYK